MPSRWARARVQIKLKTAGYASHPPQGCLCGSEQKAAFPVYGAAQMILGRTAILAPVRFAPNR